ncbi:hypothetical protein AGABI2DRAFT_191072 [Agaricus bisporus var. bisporus H97]|uniref:hypothetical protein n=1 Tax=Agaricus bisporus var. bisporus (strain H97 / ATCC MYA-4626 / FGSC 10389) TaxID=936046 RepID=UPI00029F5FA8|nr:hypothetical protein AGABI2DRAFT_191072 [Agaricus bisporus var. bisporus H97]EKV48898.1 hypothetical protein AGABI2DRAFT_191072 [Agaricus bisporus var. bisporus H97]
MNVLATKYFYGLSTARSFVCPRGLIAQVAMSELLCWHPCHTHQLRANNRRYRYLPRITICGSYAVRSGHTSLF